MRSAIACFLTAAAALLAACGSGGDESTVADGDENDASAVTVSGDESAIVEQGDDRPDNEADAASVVLVTVDLPEGADLAGTVVVALEDITYADVDAIEIASVELSVAQLLEQENRVEVFLPLPLDGSVDVTATVHIDVDENGSFSQGDWISPEVAMVTPDSASEVTVTMVQI
ncbi:MAG: hypothetical protein ACR2QK_11900 [Acidimicrobiales bacterium]